MASNKVNVMIVDDKKVNLIILESILEELEVNIIKASSGNEALGYLLDYDFAVVLLDIQMPNMDGFELARIMRTRESTAHIPIIFVTASNKEQEYVFKGYNLGAVDYLFKPIVEPKILLSKVKVFIDIFIQREKIAEQAFVLEKKIQELEKIKHELKMANSILEELSYIDALTRIANRRSFESYFGKILSNSLGQDSSITVMMLDIDFFKGYNDTYGHVEGDRCLREVAQCIKASLKRPLDFVARYGGEEFIVLLAEVDDKIAFRVAENIKNNIENMKIPHESSQVSRYVTVSIGLVSLVPRNEDILYGIVEKADAALYDAKNSGRNSIRIFSDNN
ncbi:MAG: diguanylate cyclase [Clostridiaceae bacterium]